MQKRIGRSSPFLLCLSWLLGNHNFSPVVHSFTLHPSSSAKSSSSSKITDVAVVGGGISGLVIGHVLSASSAYNVTLLEAHPEQLGGHIRALSDPQVPEYLLNIGHATHMGMFVNLRLMLQYLNVTEWPVGRGPNESPGLFRMLSISAHSGQRVQPPIDDIRNLSIWWEAFWFYYASFQKPEIALEEHLQERDYSDTFLNILYWAMATFEFDKCKEEMGTYCLGAARALLITQVFFQYLLCGDFQGILPEKIDAGLKKDLSTRVSKDRGSTTTSDSSPSELEHTFQSITEGAPLASYFTADYNAAVTRLAAGIDRIMTGAKVSSISKNGIESPKKIEIRMENGEIVQADKVILTVHPSIASTILNVRDFERQQTALQSIDSGAVGVKIIHASDLPFLYPPDCDSTAFDVQKPPCLLGMFDISQLTRSSSTGEPVTSAANHTPLTAGWLSVAHPVYPDPKHNVHDDWIRNSLASASSVVDSAAYPWTVATPSFAQARRTIEEWQGQDGVYITGQALTGVNKASELQVTNALRLCRHHFGMNPPWRYTYLYPMLPDCNDNDALYQAKSRLETINLALKSLIGSFVLTGVVNQLGTSFFD